MKIETELSFDLSDTLLPMFSSNYKRRLLAEFMQLAIRLKNLIKFLDDWDNGKLDFTPTCKREIYDRQVKAMYEYYKVLSERVDAEAELPIKINEE